MVKERLIEFIENASVLDELLKTHPNLIYFHPSHLTFSKLVKENIYLLREISFIIYQNLGQEHIERYSLFYDVVNEEFLFTIKTELFEKDVPFSQCINLYISIFDFLSEVSLFKIESFTDNIEENIVKELNGIYFFYKIKVDIDILLKEILKVDKLFTNLPSPFFIIKFAVKNKNKTCIVEVERNKQHFSNTITNSFIINTKIVDSKNNYVKEDLRLKLSFISNLESNGKFSKNRYYCYIDWIEYKNSHPYQKNCLSYTIDESQKELMRKIKKKVKNYMNNFIDVNTGKLKTIEKSLKSFVKHTRLLEMILS